MASRPDLTRLQYQMALHFAQTLAPDTSRERQQEIAQWLADTARAQLAQETRPPQQVMEEMLEGARDRGEKTLAAAYQLMMEEKQREEKSGQSTDPTQVADRINTIVSHVMKCAFPGCDETTDLQLCTRCRAISYCSKEHQRLHWKANGGHKEGCQPCSNVV